QLRKSLTEVSRKFVISGCANHEVKRYCYCWNPACDWRDSPVFPCYAAYPPDTEHDHRVLLSCNHPHCTDSFRGRGYRTCSGDIIDADIRIYIPPCKSDKRTSRRPGLLCTVCRH